MIRMAGDFDAMPEDPGEHFFAVTPLTRAAE